MFHITISLCTLAMCYGSVLCTTQAKHTCYYNAKVLGPLSITLGNCTTPKKPNLLIDMTQAYETRAIQDVRYTLAFRLD